jgi:hypothetical protein
VCAPHAWEKVNVARARVRCRNLYFYSREPGFGGRSKSNVFKFQIYGNINRRVRALYEDYRNSNPERQVRDIIIGYNEDEAINGLRKLVDKYRSNPYEVDIRGAWVRTLWVCRGNSSTATTLLEQIVKEEGRSVYKEVHWEVELFINNFTRGYHVDKRC